MKRGKDTKWEGVKGNRIGNTFVYKERGKESVKVDWWMLGDFLFSYFFIPATCVKRETFFLYNPSVHDATFIVKHFYVKLVAFNLSKRNELPSIYFH